MPYEIALLTSLQYSFAAGTTKQNEMHFPANLCWKVLISTNFDNNIDSLYFENDIFFSSGKENAILEESIK